MSRMIGSRLWMVVLLSIPFHGQVDGIAIQAGRAEDREHQNISNEPDAQKKLAMCEDVGEKCSANPAAVAYANWQICESYQASGDLKKALEYGDKALAGSPHNLDILVPQASVAQQAKDNAKLMDYAAKGGEVCHSLGKQPKAEGMSDAEFATQVSSEKEGAKNSCEFLESSAFNIIPQEKDAKTRMADIERFTAAFPDSKFQDQVSSYAIYTLGPRQLDVHTRLVSYGEKTLAANPNSLPALLFLPSFYSDDAWPRSVGKA